MKAAKKNYKQSGGSRDFDFQDLSKLNTMAYFKVQNELEAARRISKAVSIDAKDVAEAILDPDRPSDHCSQEIAKSLLARAVAKYRLI
jgi:hypothetical protein